MRFAAVALLLWACSPRSPTPVAPPGHGAVGPQSKRPIPVARGRTLYVSPEGKAGGPCSQAEPCKEIADAVGDLSAGDVVLIADGGYRRFTIDGARGTTAKPIVLFATGQGAIVHGDKLCGHRDLVCADAIFLDRVSHLVVDGLNARGAARAGIAIRYSHHVTVQNGVFGPNWRWGIFTDFVDDVVIARNEAFGSLTEHGIYHSNSGDRVTIVENWVHDNLACGIQVNADYNFKPAAGMYDGVVDGITTEAAIVDNRIENNGSLGGAAINLDGVQDSVVRGNRLAKNLGRGIVNYGDADGVEDEGEEDGNGRYGPKGMRIENNHVVMPRGARPALLFRFSTGQNWVKNNVLLHEDPARSGLELGSPRDIQFLTSDNNVLERVATNSDHQPPFGQVMTLKEWQRQYQKDLESRSAR